MEGRLEERLAAVLSAAGHDASAAPRIVRGEAVASLSATRNLALLVVDADAIQRSIFASPRPVTILGASALLRKWDEAVGSGLHEEGSGAPVAPIYAGGGTALLITVLEHAPSVATRLCERLREHTFSGTSAVLPVSPRELVEGPGAFGGGDTAAADALGIDAQGGGGFGRIVTHLMFRLRAAKGAARSHPFLQSPFGGARCGQCALRPRSKDLEGACDVCDRRLREGVRERRAHTDARSFEDLLESARRLAFVCVDGREVGKRLAACRTLGEYAALSGRLHRAFGSALDGVEHCIPVLAGGDDLLFVVPATAVGSQPDCLTLTARLLRRIEAEAEVGAGAGVLVTSGLAADLAFEHARGLCNEAKTACKEARESAVDFEVLLGGSPLADSWAALRDAEVVVEGRTRLKLTQKPYVLSRFEDLLRRARQMRALPASQLVGLREVFRDGLDVARLVLAYQFVRHDVLAKALGGEPLRPSEWVLSAERDGWVATALPDLIDASRIVGAEEAAS
ncbi:MAG: hypothetical protein NZ898_11590 [Myxococcota bacterium]|nr:hypothetical protein [Myxococcota bacterium]MDW8362895.1 hypothetical protein [Myxococcales bacterium]